MKEAKLSKQAKSFILGIYEHYKGNKYQALGVGLHSETLEEMVVYKALYGKKLIWVRPLKMFLESVVVDGTKKPRFRYLSKVKDEIADELKKSRKEFKQGKGKLLRSLKDLR